MDPCAIFMDLLLERWDGGTENLHIGLCPNAQVDSTETGGSNNKNALLCLHFLPLHRISHTLTLYCMSNRTISMCLKVWVNQGCVERKRATRCERTMYMKLSYMILVICVDPWLRSKQDYEYLSRPLVWAKDTKVQMPMAFHVCFIVQ